MLDIDLVDRAGGGVSHVAEDGEDNTRAEDATVSKLLTDMQQITKEVLLHLSGIKSSFVHSFNYLVAQLQMAIKTQEQKMRQFDCQLNCK